MIPKMCHHEVHQFVGDVNSQSYGWCNLALWRRKKVMLRSHNWVPGQRHNPAGE